MASFIYLSGTATHLAILHAHQLYVDEHPADVLRAVSLEFISKAEERDSTIHLFRFMLS